MIFLDNNSTTPIDARVQQVLEENLRDNFGNPHSNYHNYGVKAKNTVTVARGIIAEFFDVESEGVIFNSGATEANNQFIIGAALKAKREGSKRRKIFCSAVEHKCVLNSAEYTKSLGFEVFEIPVDQRGSVDIEWLKENLDEETLLVSVMAVNNETGYSSPLKEIGEIAVSVGAYFHSDFAQGLFKKWPSLYELNLDAISISGHKINGPKGVGALICTFNPSDTLDPLIHGGLQEGSLRSGTVPVFLVSALAKCIEIIKEERDDIFEYLQQLREKFQKELLSYNQEIQLNNPEADGHPGTLNLFFPNAEADLMCANLANRVAVSSAAACNGISNEYSYVLKKMGYSEDRAKNSLRLCIGKLNKDDDVKNAIAYIKDTYSKIVTCSK